MLQTHRLVERKSGIIDQLSAGQPPGKAVHFVQRERDPRRCLTFVAGPIPDKSAKISRTDRPFSRQPTRTNHDRQRSKRCSLNPTFCYLIDNKTLKSSALLRILELSQQKSVWTVSRYSDKPTTRKSAERWSRGKACGVGACTLRAQVHEILAILSGYMTRDCFEGETLGFVM